MKNISVTYIISNIDKALAFEWVAEHLPQDNIHLSFILLNPRDSELEGFLKKKNVDVVRVEFGGSKDYYASLMAIYKVLRKTQPTIIHCHMFEATLIGLLAAKIAGVKKRIYTRHHSTYNWEYNRKGVLLDRLINFLATDIVAISLNVQQVLIEKEKVAVSKIHLIRHGFDLEAFQNVSKERIAKLAQRYNPDSRWPVIGVIARFVEWKGVQYIIPAFKQLLQDYPNALLILANASGPYNGEIEKLLMNLPKESYREIGFESELFSLYQLFTVFVHTPIDKQCEAFGQTYVEALAAGIPAVFTLSGIAPEFIEHEKNAMVVSFMNSEEINKSLSLLLYDYQLRNVLIDNGKKDVKLFTLETMIRNLRKLYLFD